MTYFFTRPNTIHRDETTEYIVIVAHGEMVSCEVLPYDADYWFTTDTPGFLDKLIKDNTIRINQDINGYTLVAKWED